MKRTAAEQLIQKCKPLIDELVNLILYRSTKYNTGLYHWFYTQLTVEQLYSVHVEEADLYQDFYLYVLELHNKYKKAKKLDQYLKLALPWYALIRAKYLVHIASLSSQMANEYIISTFDNIQAKPKVDLSWLFSTKGLDLTDYEKYVMYLRLYKCYTINQISLITYKDRETVRFTINRATEIMRRHYATQNQ